MLRAVSAIYFESQALDLLLTARKDACRLLRAGTTTYSTAAPTSPTVLSSAGPSAQGSGSDPGAAPPASSSPLPPPPPSPTSSARRSWPFAAAALAVTASLGGVYFFRKLSDEEKVPGDAEGGAGESAAATATATVDKEPYPASGAELPAHVQYLLVGAGTASFAAMRAIRSARPDARVLLVGDEPALPYMRPPLSKELWREPDLAARAAEDLDALTFRQWNGRRRTVTYEPAAFYVPVASLAEEGGGGGGGGASVARGWRVARLDVARHEAELRAPGREAAVVRYDRCLVATGVRARRAAALRAAAAAGRSLAVRGLEDAARLAGQLERPDVTHVAIVGGGFLASELSAALAERLRGSSRRVTQVFRERAPLAGVLPAYLAEEVAHRLREAGVELMAETEVVASEVAQPEGPVRLRLASGAALEPSLVVECVGSEVDAELARASQLETDPGLGGLLVNAELQARADVYAAGDVACFYDVALGRRRVEHHDHAVVSGRLAGENMAAVGPAKHYTHQSMFWSDLGPHLGYEAIGIVDSRLPTVGVFCADAVTDARAAAGAEGEVRVAGAATGVAAGAVGEVRVAGAAAGPGPEGRRYARGVVFYVRERRVVGVLLWNLFNRMHVARQVLAQAEFDDLFEVAKLFSLHEDD